MARRVTSQDVADLAGVSRTAVSLVLNGHGLGNIAAEKQEAIRAAARQLGYVPNAAAVNLRVQRTRTVGVLTDTIATSAFGGAVLAGAMETARTAGYVCMVVDTEDLPGAESEAVDVLNHRQVDGLVFAAQSLREHSFDRLPTPGVLANCTDPLNRHTAYFPDEASGGRLATQVVLDHGHHNVWHLSGTRDRLATGLRETSYREAMTAAGSTPHVVECGWMIRDGYRCASELLSVAERPTAVVCANDRVALGVVLAAAHAGLDVPGDLSVVGYDDDENVAPMMVPPLTTVALPHREMGERAMRTLLDLLDGVESPPTQVPVPGPLVVRDSVAPPR